MSPRTWKIFSTIMMAFLLASAARAQFFTPTYTDYVKNLHSQWQEVVVARGLDAPQAHLVQRVAAAWFHIGPCNGDGRRLASPDDGVSAIQYVAMADPK